MRVGFGKMDFASIIHSEWMKIKICLNKYSKQHTKKNNINNTLTGKWKIGENNHV